MAKRIPQNKVDEIYAVADIVDVVGEFVELKKRGSNFFGLSPWTNEKTPSFSVSPAKNIFKDFSSGKGGNAVTFLMELEGMTYVESLQYLAKKYGIDIEYEDEEEEDPESKDRRESLYVISSFAERFYHDRLLNSEEGKRIGLSYFRERGILESTIDKFGLGYAPDQWEALSNEAEKNKYDPEYLVEAGLAFRSDKTGNLIDRFRGRVMFPIHTHLGKTVAFGGRILRQKEGRKEAKYINSPETEIYHKSKVLYGLYHARQDIRDQDQAILVEGYMDVVSLYQSGIRNSVASSGTALTEDQIRLIKRFTKNVMLIYDSDRAGVEAAVRGAGLMLSEDMSVRILLLPEGEDPDSFVKREGKSGFEKIVKEQSKEFLEFRLDQLMKEKDIDDPGGRTEVLNDVAGTLALVPDPVRRGVYLSFAAERLKVPEELLNTAVARAIDRKQRFDKRKSRSREEKQERIKEEYFRPVEGGAKSLLYQEKELLRLLVNYPSYKVEFDGSEFSLSEFLFHALEGLEFTEKITRSLLELLHDEHLAGGIKIDRVLDKCSAEQRDYLSDLLTVEEEVSEQWKKYSISAPRLDEDLNEALIKATQYYQWLRLKRLLAENERLISTASNPEEEQDLLRTHLKLQDLVRRKQKEIGIVGSLRSQAGSD